MERYRGVFDMLRKCMLVVLLILLMSIQAFAIDVGDFVYDGDSAALDLSTLDDTPRVIKLNNDGTKVYVAGRQYDNISEFTLSEPYDLSTGVYTFGFDISGQETAVGGVEFKPSGDKFWVIGETSDTIHQYSMSVAWDLSTASYDSVTKLLSGQDLKPTDIAFNNDGTVMFMVGNNDDTLYQYNLSSPYDITTLAIEDEYDVGSLQPTESSPLGICFANNGYNLLMTGAQTTSYLYQFSMTEPYRLDTLSYQKYIVLKDDSLTEIKPRGVTINSTENKMYIVGDVTLKVHSYTIPPPAPDTCTYSGSGDWEITISDNCVLDTDTDIGANKLIITGDDGILTVSAKIYAKEIHYQPDEFDGGFIIKRTTGGELASRP